MSLDKLLLEPGSNTSVPNTEDSNSIKPKKPNTSKESSSLINDEFCNYCDEGGNLINCDRCPASFHLLCHDPPLDNDQIPKGEFLCNKCKSNSKMGIVLTATNSRLAHFEKNKNNSALDALCRMAKAINPREMHLSNELSLECDFEIPGLSRIKWFANEYKLKTRSTSRKKEDTKNANKNFCYLCSKFDSIKKMTKCDFCETNFHQDCLFMLVSEIPIKDKIWMCPLHSEHCLNAKFLKTEKLSEKIKLWNSFQVKNYDQVEREFLEKCKSKSSLNSSQDSPLEYSIIPKQIKHIYLRHEIPKEKSCFDDILTACEALRLLSCSNSETVENLKIKIPSLDKNDLVRPRALLKYVSDENSNQELFDFPIPLSKSSTTIGNSLRADVCLRNSFIKCAHLSDKHATIFYDYLTNKYELLNYSEFGTQVNNFNLGFCLDNKEESDFWEGPIELQHGSIVKMGCFRFLFVIIDYEFKFDLNLSKENILESNNIKIRKNLNKKSKKVKHLNNNNSNGLFQSKNKVNLINFLNSKKDSAQENALSNFINNVNKKNLIF